MTADPSRIASLDELKSELQRTLARIEEVEAREPDSVDEIDARIEGLQVEIDRLKQLRQELER